MIGVVANVFYLAAGYDIGKPSTQLIEQLKYSAEIKKAQDILAKFSDRVILPFSVAVRQNGKRAEYPIDKIPADAPVMDLGMDSLARLVSTLKKSGTVVFNAALPVCLRTRILPREPSNYFVLRQRSNSRLSVEDTLRP